MDTKGAPVSPATCTCRAHNKVTINKFTITFAILLSSLN